MRPAQIFRSCKIGASPLYSIGTFHSGVTVLSQQIRALNLAWAFIEGKIVDCVIPNRRTNKPKTVAIVGGGFAGLTFAAGLIAKRANVEITIFEERDTLLPLQHGSDSRWLHPQIYNWPGQRSEMNVAMLPVLNWSAARASDVVVQIMTEWKAIVERAPLKPKLYCNARHLQVTAAPGNRLAVEWVGERRNPADATMDEDAQVHAIGASKVFDHVVLAVGFGLEQHDAISYWRNEQLGQPSLDQPRKTFLVSGQGDGAMIDLLRLRISHYRPDRILDQLFSDKPKLLGAIEDLYRRDLAAKRPTSLFTSFESLDEQDLVVHSKHRALAFRLRINADAHGIQEIAGPVKIEFGSIALRTNQDNRLVGIGREVEPIRGLLKRVGSMRNDNASYFRSGECTVDFAG
jgi:FAD-NAD(P)-binding